MQNWRFGFLFLAMALFVLLAYKNPYGEHSLIGNFDPFPDSLHYVVPAQNFVKTGDFGFARQGGEVKIGVPPLYSWTLIPVYFFLPDARSFYFANILLGLLSIFLLYKIAWRLSNSIWATGLLLFAYSTSFVIYWQPTLAMAENVLLPVTLVVLYLLLDKLTPAKAALASLLAIACYGSKYVSWPLTAVFLLYIWLITYRQNPGKKWWQSFFPLLAGSAALGFLVMDGARLWFYVQQFYNLQTTSSSLASNEVSWFKLANLQTSLLEYTKALLGWPIYNLWHTKPILPFGWSAVVVVFLLAGLRMVKYRALASLILALLVAQLAFLGLITMIEGRYAFALIAVVFTGAAALAGWLSRRGHKRLAPHRGQLMEIAVSGLLALTLLVQRWPELKTQLLLNYRGGETPWWQIGVQAADRFLLTENEKANEKQPAWLISSLSPFVWDFYRQADYLPMPLTMSQSMAGEEIWGIELPKIDLVTFYRDAITQGQVIYLSTVGFGHLDWPVLDNYLEAGLELKPLQEDCLGACKLYQIELVKE